MDWQGNIDATCPKALVVCVFPLASILIALLLSLFSRNESSEVREKIRLYLVLTGAFFSFVEILFILKGVHPDVRILGSFLVGLNGFFLGIFWGARGIPQNKICGFRNVWTLRSAKVWKATHSRLSIIGIFVTCANILLLAIIDPPEVLIITISDILLLCILSFFVSWRYSKIFALVLVIGFVSISGEKIFAESMARLVEKPDPAGTGDPGLEDDLFPEAFPDFRYVGATGGVFYHEKLFSLATKSGEELPLHLLFDSKRNFKSEILGYGWRLLPVDAYVYPIDDRRYYALLPNGESIVLHKMDGNGNFGTATSGWRARSDRKTLEIHSKFRPQRYFFKNGKIEKISLSDKETLVIVRNANGTMEIRESASRLLLINCPPNAVGAGSLVAGGKAVKFENTLTEHLAWNGKTLKNFLLPRLTHYQKNQTGRGREYVFDHGLNSGTMALRVLEEGNGKTKLEWDVKDGSIVGHNACKYSFESDKNDISGDVFRLKQVDGENKISVLARDQYKGTEERVNRDGSGHRYVWHVGGSMHGLIKTITLKSPTGESKEIRNFYDENGVFVRQKTISP
jgi:hypothetical protein